MELPRRLGPFVPIRSLGQGGMADVYLAKQWGDLGVERLVAIKTIRQGLYGGSDAARLRDQFAREARLASSLSHHNVVHVYDSGNSRTRSSSRWSTWKGRRWAR